MSRHLGPIAASWGAVGFAGNVGSHVSIPVQICPSGLGSCKAGLQAAFRQEPYMPAAETCPDSDVPGAKNLSSVRSVREYPLFLVARFRRVRADATLLSVTAVMLLLSCPAAWMSASVLPLWSWPKQQRPLLNCRCGGAVTARPFSLVLQFQLSPAFHIEAASRGVHSVVALQAIICIVHSVARARHV